MFKDNVAIKWLPLLHCMWGIPGSILCPEAEYPVSSLSHVSSVLPGKC